MDEDTVENIPYKFELKKLTGDELSLNNTLYSEIHSDTWVNDLNSVSEDKLQEENVDNNVTLSILYSKDTDETELTEENIDIYSDLIKLEEEQKKIRQIREAEFENCKKELEKLKEADAKNKTRIEELTKENENLKKSICSLYKTCKNEIEIKDEALAEANNELSRLKTMEIYKSELNLRNDMCPNCINNTSTFKKDSNISKRKRSESPESSSKKRECISGTSRSYEVESRKDMGKLEKNSEHEITRNKHDLEFANNKDEKNVFHKQISKNLNCDKETQASDQCIFCQTSKNSNAAKNSRDPKEINDMFFNLLPDSLKQSFYDYEQDQMISLNKLKKKFIDEYFYSKSDIPSPVLESTPKTKDNRTDKGQLTPDKSLKNRSSTTISTPTSSSEHRKSSESSRSTRRRHKTDYKNEAKRDYPQSHITKIPKNCYNSRLAKKDQKDLVSLFMYRKEKIPFVEKKKFGLHKNDKKLIPEKIL